MYLRVIQELYSLNHIWIEMFPDYVSNCSIFCNWSAYTVCEQLQHYK